MRAARFAWLLLVAFAHPVAAATDYWAFGDSVSRGEGGGFVLDPVSGHDCTTNPYPVNKCGYHWRLEDALGGVANEVFNRGKAAEATAMGKTRVDDPGEPLNTSRCTDAEAGDVILVMEGTNDISPPAVSTTTIKANLGEILDLATAQCVHSAVASTIRRLLSGTALGSKTGEPGHAATSDLATAISDLATEKNRAYVDVFGSLCPDQSCYNSHFWGRLAMNEPGHVDASGYDVMSPLFEAAITASPAAGAATLTSPSGDVLTGMPPFVWDEQADADWYFLEVDSGSSYGRWHPEEEICSGGTCTFDPMVALADGDHSWRVRTRNLRGVGAWSSPTEFTVYTVAPGAAVLSYPETATFDTMPPYEWPEVANATEYDLEVDTTLIEETHTAASICSNGVCSVTPATALGLGSHSWRVRTRNPFDDGPWSAAKPFDVITCTAGDVSLPGATEGGTKLETACGDLTAGEMGNYTVAGPNGDVTFHAGDAIILHDGFTVEQDAEFTARVDK